LLVLAQDQWECPFIALLSDEIVKDEPGQTAVLDRLLDVMLIAVLRAWFARPEAEAPAWYRAQSDPIVGRALRIPTPPWARSPGRWATAARSRSAPRSSECAASARSNTA